MSLPGLARTGTARYRRWLGLAAMGLMTLAGVLVVQRWIAPPAKPPTAFQTTTWEELVPKDWDPLKRFRDMKVDRISEGDAKEFALMREMRALWDNAPTRGELDGAHIRLAGFVVPLENVGGELKEFLLVPYFGACIHSPPPPANQIVHVVLSKPLPLSSMDAVWTSGTLSIHRQDSPWGKSGYRLQGYAVERYKSKP